MLSVKSFKIFLKKQFGQWGKKGGYWGNLPPPLEFWGHKYHRFET